MLDGCEHDLLGLLDEAIVGGRAGKAAHHDLRLVLDHAGNLVDGEDGQDEAVFTEMTAVADDQLFDHVAGGTGVNADASDRDGAGFARAELVEFQYLAALQKEDLADGSGHGGGQGGVQLELTVFAVDGDEVLRAHEIDEQLQFFLAGVTADVQGRLGAIFVEDFGVAAEEMVDNAIDSFFIAGNDARRKDRRCRRARS